MSRLGYHIINFTLPGVDSASLFDSVVAQAKEAEQAGFDQLSVMDHFFQHPGIGHPTEPMVECYTLLAALAQHTTTTRLAALVTGVSYRNPALLAKIVTALDIVSGGRATLGMGAGWYQLEHEAMGYDFGTFTDRFEKLEDALQIIIPMLRGDTATHAGKHYSATDAHNTPAPVSRVPIMIGGSGEKKTLRMVAQYADESNLAGVNGPADITRKREVLAEHCERIGRDPSEITMSLIEPIVVAPTMEDAENDLRAMAEVMGWNDAATDAARTGMIFGDPDTVGERITALIDAGLDGICLALPTNGHIPGRITLAADIANRALT